MEVNTMIDHKEIQKTKEIQETKEKTNKRKKIERKDEIDTVIFDIGGVLVSDGGRRPRLFAKYNLILPEEYKLWDAYKTGKLTEKEYWMQTLKGTYLEGKEKELAQEMRDVFAQAKPGPAVPFVSRVKNAGYQTAILSNHSSEWGRITLGTVNVSQYCNPILISAEIKLAKPDPKIYEYTLRAVNKTKTPEKCLFIDDLERNTSIAREMGIKTITLREDTDLEKEIKVFGVRI